MRVIILAIGLLISLSGCPFLTGSAGSIVFLGDTNVTSAGFHMEGHIQNSGQGDPPKFSNVKVYLYSKDKRLIQAYNVGTLARRADISVRSDVTPEYVVINSPEFWQTGKISVSYYELVEKSTGRYSAHVIGSKDELPVQLPT